MVKKGDEVEMAKLAIPIADELLAAAKAAAGGNADFRADKLRLKLAALPINSDPALEKMPPAMVDLLVWIAETSLKSSMSILYSDENAMYSIVLNVLSVKQGYSGLSALPAWGDIPEKIWEQVVMPLVRSYEWDVPTSVWKFGDIGEDLITGTAMKIAFMRLLKHAVKDAASTVDANITLFQGDHNRIDLLVATWVKKERHGRAIPLQHMPSVTLLAALLKMRNMNWVMFL